MKYFENIWTYTDWIEAARYSAAEAEKVAEYFDENLDNQERIKLFADKLFFELFERLDSCKKLSKESRESIMKRLGVGAEDATTVHNRFVSDLEICSTAITVLSLRLKEFNIEYKLKARIESFTGKTPTEIKGVDKADIKTEELAKYFKPRFKGMGGAMNNFDTMINNLRLTPFSDKDLARIALMIYESKEHNDHVPKTFSAWNEIFFGIMGRNCSKKYKPNQLKCNSNKLPTLFASLL